MPRNNTFIINLLTFIIVKICTLFQFQCQLAFWVSIIKITLFISFVPNMSSYNNLNFPVARKRRINTVQTLRNVTRKPVPFRLLLISSPCVCKKPQKSKFQEFKKFKNPNFFSKLLLIQIFIKALGGPSNG